MVYLPSYTSSITEQQRFALKQYSNTKSCKPAINPLLLKGYCPLKYWYGGQRPKPNVGVLDLGDLDKLPLELLYEIFGYIDVKSLIAVRDMGLRAQAVVDGMPEWKKIMDHAPDTVRLATGIRSAHTFTIKQLFAKLTQRTCDGENCNKMAPFLEIFTVSRRCLGAYGPCSGTTGILTYPQLRTRYHDRMDDNIDLSSVPHFRPIDDTGVRSNLIHYSSAAVDGILPPPITNLKPANTYHEWFKCDRCRLSLMMLCENMQWQLCSVMAPYLGEKSSLTEYDEFYCPVCFEKRSKGEPAIQSRVTMHT